MTKEEMEKEIKRAFRTAIAALVVAVLALLA
jgi:hypothetical protein